MKRQRISRPMRVVEPILKNPAFYEQKFSNLTPVCSITFPQGFQKSKNFGNWEVEAKRQLNGVRKKSVTDSLTLDELVMKTYNRLFRTNPTDRKWNPVPRSSTGFYFLSAGFARNRRLYRLHHQLMQRNVCANHHSRRVQSARLAISCTLRSFTKPPLFRRQWQSHF